MSEDHDALQESRFPSWKAHLPRTPSLVIPSGAASRNLLSACGVAEVGWKAAGCLPTRLPTL